MHEWAKELAELFILNGVDINYTNNYGETALHLACNNNRKEIIKILLSNGIDINHTTNKGYTALFYACKNTQPESVQLLIDAGANIYATDDFDGLYCTKPAGIIKKRWLNYLLKRSGY